MTLAASALLVLASIATLIVFSAIRLGATSRLRCGASCGAFVEPYAGIRGESGNLFCSMSCARRSRRPDVASSS